MYKCESGFHTKLFPLKNGGKKVGFIHNFVDLSRVKPHLVISLNISFRDENWGISMCVCMCVCVCV